MTEHHKHHSLHEASHHSTHHKKHTETKPKGEAQVHHSQHKHKASQPLKAADPTNPLAPYYIDGLAIESGDPPVVGQPIVVNLGNWANEPPRMMVVFERQDETVVRAETVYNTFTDSYVPTSDDIGQTITVYVEGGNDYGWSTDRPSVTTSAVLQTAPAPPPVEPVGPVGPSGPVTPAPPPPVVPAGDICIHCGYDFDCHYQDGPIHYCPLNAETDDDQKLFNAITYFETE
jgi:hypothetical protein